MSDIPERLTAALLDRYVVERGIGAGGMATATWLATSATCAWCQPMAGARGCRATPQMDSGGSGLEVVAAPGQAEESALLRLQLALTLASQVETREEGIRSLRHAFQLQPLYAPLTHLALGRTTRVVSILISRWG